jgi:hypothetical protein
LVRGKCLNMMYLVGLAGGIVWNRHLVHGHLANKDT